MNKNILPLFSKKHPPLILKKSLAWEGEGLSARQTKQGITPKNLCTTNFSLVSYSIFFRHDIMLYNVGCNFISLV